MFAAIVGNFIYKPTKPDSAAKWLCLIPIIGGVALTVLKPADPTAPLIDQLFQGFPKLDGGFSVGSLIGAMIANIFAAFKGKENHNAMEDKVFKEKIGSTGNQFAIMTIISFFASVPLMFIYPIVATGAIPSSPKEMIDKAISSFTTFYMAFTTNSNAFSAVVISGISFYLYNEFATMSLKKLDTVTQSVANTAKRVFTIVAGIYMFKEQYTVYTVIGCTICMIGVGIHACVDDLFKPRESIAGQASVKKTN